MNIELSRSLAEQKARALQNAAATRRQLSNLNKRPARPTAKGLSTLLDTFSYRFSFAGRR